MGNLLSTKPTVAPSAVSRNEEVVETQPPTAEPGPIIISPVDGNVEEMEIFYDALPTPKKKRRLSPDVQTEPVLHGGVMQPSGDGVPNVAAGAADDLNKFEIPTSANEMQERIKKIEKEISALEARKTNLEKLNFELVTKSSAVAVVPETELNTANRPTDESRPDINSLEDNGAAVRPENMQINSRATLERVPNQDEEQPEGEIGELSNVEQNIVVSITESDAVEFLVTTPNQVAATDVQAIPDPANGEEMELLENVNDYIYEEVLESNGSTTVCILKKTQTPDVQRSVPASDATNDSVELSSTIKQEIDVATDPVMETGENKRPRTVKSYMELEESESEDGSDEDFVCDDDGDDDEDCDEDDEEDFDEEY